MVLIFCPFKLQFLLLSRRGDFSKICRIANMQRELQELSRHLESSYGLHDVRLSRALMAKVHSCLVKGIDLSPLAGSVMKYLSYPDVLVKKVVCAFLVRYSSKITDLSILATNSLLRDFKDPNPLFRGISIATLFSVPCIVDQGIPLLHSALSDSSPHVRRIGITCCSKLFHMKPSMVDELYLVDKLYAMIRDQDPIVVTHCLSTLDEILKEEGGIVINRKITFYLLEHLNMFQNWNVETIFHILKKYQPSAENEALEFINALDPYLNSDQASVQIHALNLFSLVTEKFLPHLVKDAIVQVWLNLSIHLAFGNQELVYTVLRFAELFVEKYPEVFQPYYRDLFCSFTDTYIVKIKKLSIIYHLATENTVDEITKELHLHSLSADIRICKSSLSALTILMNKFPTICDKNLVRLIEMLNLPREDLVTEVLTTICKLDIGERNNMQQLLLDTVMKRKWTMINAKGKCTVINLIGEYGRDFSLSTYVLEDYIENLSPEEEPLVKHALLSTAVKLFLLRPSELQDSLGHLFDILTSDKVPDVREQALYYYRLLQSDIKAAGKVVLSNKYM